VDPVDAVRVVLGQWPDVVALTGIGALAVGIGPRLAPVAWLGVGVGALIAFLGTLLDLPGWITSSGLYAQAASWNSIWLLTLGVSTAVTGCLTAARRDLRREQRGQGHSMDDPEDVWPHLGTTAPRYAPARRLMINPRVQDPGSSPDNCTLAVVRKLHPQEHPPVLASHGFARARDPAGESPPWASP